MRSFKKDSRPKRTRPAASRLERSAEPTKGLGQCDTGHVESLADAWHRTVPSPSWHSCERPTFISHDDEPLNLSLGNHPRIGPISIHGGLKMGGDISKGILHVKRWLDKASHPLPRPCSNVIILSDEFVVDLARADNRPQSDSRVDDPPHAAECDKRIVVALAVYECAGIKDERQPARPAVEPFLFGDSEDG